MREREREREREKERERERETSTLRLSLVVALDKHCSFILATLPHNAHVFFATRNMKRSARARCENPRRTFSGITQRERHIANGRRNFCFPPLLSHHGHFRRAFCARRKLMRGTLNSGRSFSPCLVRLSPSPATRSTFVNAAYSSRGPARRDGRVLSCFEHAACPRRSVNKRT